MSVKRMSLVMMGLVIPIMLAQSSVASAAEIKVLCSNGIKAVMEELTPQFEQATKHKVVITYGLSAVLKRQIEAGEPFDIAVLTPPLIDDTIKQGKIAGDTRTVLARSGMALAIRVGAPKPDIRTTAALKRTLLESKSIAYAREGASGVFFTELVQRLGLADGLKPKVRLTTTGEEVGRSVARGDAELGVLPVSEILPVHGVEVLGTFPADVQGYVVMVAGVGPGSTQKAAAKEFIKFLTAPAALPVIKKKGMEPAQTSAPAVKTVAARQGSRSSRAVLHASVGPELTQYDVDVESATLVKRSSVTLPANVQEAWLHPSRQYLYVAWSNGGPSYVTPGGLGSSGSQHGVSAFRIDPTSGALHPHGQPASLPSRPIHITTDTTGAHVLLAYNAPSGVTVHRIAPDGTVGSQVKQPAPLDAGIYGHQIRVDPSNKTVILVTRGNGPAGGTPEDPGALKIFRYKDGLLTNWASIAPGGGFNFQPRHLDFHPSRPWVFVSLERQNKLQVYEKLKDDSIGPKPLFSKDTLADPGNVRRGQAASTLHVHPNGRFVYLANRASSTIEFQGKPVFVGGENNIAVYAIDQDTGEPTLIQNIDTRGMHPRTFALDSSGRILVAANQLPLSVRDGQNVKTIPASLAVYRVRGDGKLDFVRKYDVETGGSRNLFWTGGLVSLP